MDNFCSSIRTEESYLKNCLDYLVKKINLTELTIYSYVGDEKHHPIYYEETELFKKMLAKANLRCKFVEVFDADFAPSNWEAKNSLLHIPGAISTELDAHLKAKVAEIQEFVHRGGRFLGWCGGAYWACGRVRYIDSQTILEKVRNLALWKGTEEGPLLPFLGNPEGNIGFFHGAVKVKWPGSDSLRKFFPEGLEANVLLSGGGSFIPAEDEYEYKILATYGDVEKQKCLAGVKTYVGKGVAILINPYFTHGADYLRSGLEGYEQYFPQHNWRKIVDDLEGAELKSMICFVDMLLEAAQNYRSNDSKY